MIHLVIIVVFLAMLITLVALTAKRLNISSPVGSQIIMQDIWGCNEGAHFDFGTFGSPITRFERHI